MNLLQRSIIQNLSTEDTNFDLDFKLNSINIDEIKTYISEIKPFLIEKEYVENLHENVWKFTTLGKKVFFDTK